MFCWTNTPNWCKFSKKFTCFARNNKQMQSDSKSFWGALSLTHNPPYFTPQIRCKWMEKVEFIGAEIFTHNKCVAIIKNNVCMLLMKRTTLSCTIPWQMFAIETNSFQGNHTTVFSAPNTVRSSKTGNCANLTQFAATTIPPHTN